VELYYSILTRMSGCSPSVEVDKTTWCVCGGVLDVAHVRGDVLHVFVIHCSFVQQELEMIQ